MAVSAEHLLGDSKQDAIQLVRELFIDASREHKKRIPKWNRSYRLLKNDSWSQYRAQWLPSPASSEIYPAISTLVAYVGSQQPQAFISPKPELPDGIKPDPELVKQKTGLMQKDFDSWWLIANAQKQLKMGLWDLFTYGAGILKTGFDLSTNDGEGRASLNRVDPYNALPDPLASGMHDLRYFIEARDAPVFEVLRRFPDARHLIPSSSAEWPLERRPKQEGGLEVVPNANYAATGVQGDFPGTASPGMAPRFGFSRGLRAEDYTKTVRLIECWVRESDLIEVPMIIGPKDEDETGYTPRVDTLRIEIPTWRLIVVAGNEVVHDDDNPFSHQSLPYIRLPMVEIGEFWPMSLVDHLAPPQIAINRLLAAMQTNAELTGNPILIDVAQAGISKTAFTAKPGARVTISNQGLQPSWMDPPKLSNDILALIQDYRAVIDRISGVSDTTRGQGLRRREPAEAVDASQEAAFTRIGDVLRNAEEAVREACNQIISNIAQYSIEPRVIPLVGPEGTAEYVELGPKPFYYPIPDGDQIRDVQLQFACTIEAGSSLPLSHQAKVSEAMSLLFAGVIDPTAVLEIVKIPGWEKIAERMSQSMAMGMLQPGGQNPRNRPG